MAGAGRGRKRGGGSGGGQSTRPEQEEEFVQEDPMQTDGDGEETDATDEPARVPIRYTSDHRMILEPTGLWFMDDCVIRGVTKSTKTNFVGPIPTSWTQASHAQREAWFNNFRLSFAWSPSQEQNVRIRYNDVGTRRYRDVIWKVVRRPKEPDHMKGDKYEGLIKHTKSEAFQKKSKQASLNKRGGKEDAVNEPTHYAGSRSFWNRMLGVSTLVIHQRDDCELIAVNDPFITAEYMAILVFVFGRLMLITFPIIGVY
ncbi:uncharacterized protein LOC141601761 [Silene latifolia]|uniref:uncharacterized protein LOC141601761 n=2 Tax=Silene latifolia TaxID=37657 RepID=UPI003D77CDA0